MKHYLCIIAGLLFFACAPTKFARLAGIQDADESIDLIYVDGNDVLISKKAHSQVAVMGKGRQRMQFHGGQVRLKFRVYIENISDDRINVFPDAIKAKAIDEYGSFHDVMVYSPDKYLEEIEGRQSLTLGLMAAGKMIGTAFSGVGQTKTRSSTTGYIGNTTVNLSTQQSTIDDSKRDQTYRQDAAELRDAAALLAQTYATIQMSLLKKHTLFPGDAMEGDVFAKDKRKATPETAFLRLARFQITIPIAQDVHKFTFAMPEKQ